MPSPRLTFQIKNTAPKLKELPQPPTDQFEKKIDGVTIETVDAVVSPGRYLVRGWTVSSTGESDIHAGDRVQVLWYRDVPLKIIAHDAKTDRCRGADVSPVKSLVEELFVGVTRDGSTDVFYRNWATVAPLGVRKLGVPSDAVIDGVRWGADRSSMAVRFSTHKFAIFSIARASAELPLPSGQAISLQLERVVDITAGSPPLLTLAARRSGTGKRWTATEINEEPRKASIVSYTVGPESDPNPPHGCRVQASSSTCRTAAQKAALAFCITSEYFVGLTLYVLGCAPCSPQKEVFKSQAGADPLDAFTPDATPTLVSGDVSVDVAVNRSVTLSAEFFDPDGEFVLSINDFFLPRKTNPKDKNEKHQLIVNVLMRAQFTSANKAGDSSVASTVQQAYTNTPTDPHWTPNLRPFAQPTNTNPVPQLQAGFDVRETHSFMVDGATGAVIWSTTGAVAKTLETIEEYSWLDDNNDASTSPFDDAFTGPTMVLPTAALGWDGIEPNRSTPKFGVKGHATLDGAYVGGVFTHDLLFIGAGLATEEVARVTATGATITIDRSLAYDHYQGEVVFRQPGGIYYEQENSGDSCNVQQSIVDFCPPGTPGGNAITIAFALAGKQGKKQFENDLWDHDLFLIGDDQYVTEESTEACVDTFKKGDLVASHPTNWPATPGITNHDDGFNATWSMVTQRARHVVRYRVRDHVIILWHREDAALTRWAIAVERYDVVDGTWTTSIYVTDGAGNVLDTPRDGSNPARRKNVVVAFIAWTQDHLVWTERDDAADPKDRLDLRMYSMAGNNPGPDGGELITAHEDKIAPFDFRGLQPDFLYQTRPVNKEKFAAGWDFKTKGVFLLNPGLKSYPQSDPAMQRLGALANQSTGEQAVSSGAHADRTRDYQIINSTAALSLKGRFEKEA